MQEHKGVLHLQPTEPINVLGRDERGGFSDSWFPFLAGAAIGNALGGSRGPPPTTTSLQRLRPWRSTRWQRHDVLAEASRLLHG